MNTRARWVSAAHLSGSSVDLQRRFLSCGGLGSASLKSKYEPSRSQLAPANCRRRVITRAVSLARPGQVPNGSATEYFRCHLGDSQNEAAHRRSGKSARLPLWVKSARSSRLEERLKNTMHPEQFGFLLLWKSFVVQIFLIFLIFCLSYGSTEVIKMTCLFQMGRMCSTSARLKSRTELSPMDIFLALARVFMLASESVATTQASHPADPSL